MAKIIITKQGYKVVQTNAIENLILNFGNICDDCCKPQIQGYYIPVMNRWYCEDCFKDWEKSVRYYAEDIPIEKKHLKYVINFLKENEVSIDG